MNLSRCLVPVVLGICLFCLATSCGAPEQVSYLQDLQRDIPMEVQQPQQLKLKPGDRLRITVFSRDRELSALFNLSNMGSTNLYGANSGGGSGVSGGQYLSYTVDPEGYVEIPTLGRVLVEGLTRLEVAERVKDKLIETQLLLDPTVIVDYHREAYTHPAEDVRITFDKRLRDSDRPDHDPRGHCPGR